MNQYIPLCVPSLKGNELKYVKECIDTEWVSSAGLYVEKFELAVAKYTNTKFAIACINGTSALQVSLRIAGVKPNDEVIAPTLTFIAPINAIMYNYAYPIFMDSDRYYNLHADKVISFIKNETFYKNGFSYNKSTDKRVSAIIPVHVWGNACLLDDLVLLCNERNISIIEDASESLGTYYKEGNHIGKHTGTIGTLGCISFNGNKIITSGGGGIILTDDEKLAAKARYLTTQAKDDPVRYRHDEIGYNFRLSNIQAAIGMAQMEQLDLIIERKKEIYTNYQLITKNISNLSISRVPNYSINNHWINILEYNSEDQEEKTKYILSKLSKLNIQTRPIWRLNHLQKPYQNCQSYQIEIAEDMVFNKLCIPSSSNLSFEEQKRVIDSILK